jgi:polyhydroxybutyrate depolymerase
MLHPANGSASQAERDYHWDAEADSGHFAVAYPDGLNASWGAGGGCCGASGLDHVDDVAVIAAMVATIERENPIDPDQVYAAGISQGGVLAYALASAQSS